MGRLKKKLVFSDFSYTINRTDFLAKTTEGTAPGINEVRGTIT